MSRIQQTNELLRSELAKLINRADLVENCLITISYIDCSKDLKRAKIGFSVLPENLSGTVLKKLRKSSSQFTKILKERLRLKYIPKFNWLIDSTESQAAEIEELLEEIKNR